MMVNNTTDYPNSFIREVVRFTRPPGISNFDVEIRNTPIGVCGRAYTKGCKRHRTDNWFVVVRIGPTDTFPITLSEHGAYFGTRIHTRENGFVYVMAHELRHLWQAKGKGRRKGMVWGARGKFSERDAEAYALRMLRAWRRR